MKIDPARRMVGFRRRPLPFLSLEEGGCLVAEHGFIPLGDTLVEPVYADDSDAAEVITANEPEPA